MNDTLVEFIAMENISFAKVDKSSLRKLLFTGNPDYVSPSSTTIKQLMYKKSNIVEAALRKEIIKDSVDAGHMTVSIMFDGGSAKDRMKSKKHAITIHRTTKEFEIKMDNIRLDKCVGNLLANIFWTIVYKVLGSFGYEPHSSQYNH